MKHVAPNEMYMTSLIELDEMLQFIEIEYPGVKWDWCRNNKEHLGYGYKIILHLDNNTTNFLNILRFGCIMEHYAEYKKALYRKRSE